MATHPWSREPALLLVGIAAPSAQLVLSYLPWPGPLTLALEAAAVAAAGLGTAALTRRDQLVPAIAGFAQALLVLSLALGVPIDHTQRALVMTLVGLITAAWVRTQVEATTPAARSSRHAATR